MGIFDRIRKFFSRSESSRTNRASSRLVQGSYRVGHYQRFDVSTNRTRSSNVIETSSANVLHRSNTTSITTQAPSRSHSQPDANLNSCNAPILPLLRDTVYLPEYAKKRNTAVSVSELPRLKGSNELKDDSKISIANNYRRKYLRPNDSEAVSAEYNTTIFGESKREAASDLNGIQSTPKPKPTLNRNILSSARNIDNVNHHLDFWKTTKRSSTESKSTENKSSVEKDRQGDTSKEPNPVTSQAKIVHSMSYRTPAISHQEVLLNKNHMIQTLSNTNTSTIDCSYIPHKIERKLSVYNQGVGHSGKRQHTTAFSTTETSRSSKTSIIDRSFTPHKIECKLSDHNRGVGGSGNTQPRQQTTTFTKTETPSISQTSAFSSSNTQHKIERPKVSDHNWGIRETFGNLQQSVTLNKTNTTQIYRVSNASDVVPPMTSYKRDITTVPDHRSVRMDELKPKGISCGPSTIPQLTRNYVDVDKVSKAPRASILKPLRLPSVFHSGKGN